MEEESSNNNSNISLIISSNGKNKESWENLVCDLDSGDSNIPNNIISILNENLVDKKNIEITLDILDFLVHYGTPSIIELIAKKEFLKSILELLKVKNSTKSNVNIQKKIIFLTKKWAKKYENSENMKFSYFTQNYNSLKKGGIVFPPDSYKLETYTKYISDEEAQCAQMKANVISKIKNENQKTVSEDNNENVLANPFLDEEKDDKVNDSSNDKKVFDNQSTIKDQKVLNKNEDENDEENPYREHNNEDKNENDNDNNNQNEIKINENNKNHDNIINDEDNKIKEENKKIGDEKVENSGGKTDKKDINKEKNENNINSEENINNENNDKIINKIDDIVSNNLEDEEKKMNKNEIKHNENLNLNNKLRNNKANCKEPQDQPSSRYPKFPSQFKDNKNQNLGNNDNNKNINNNGNNFNNQDIRRKRFNTAGKMNINRNNQFSNNNNNMNNNRNNNMSNVNNININNNMNYNNINIIMNNNMNNNRNMNNYYNNNNYNMNNNNNYNRNNYNNNNNNNYYRTNTNYNNNNVFNNNYNNISYPSFDNSDPISYKRILGNKLLQLNGMIDNGKYSFNSQQLKAGIKEIINEITKCEYLMNRCQLNSDKGGYQIFRNMRMDIEQTCSRYEDLISGRNPEPFRSSFTGNSKQYYFNKNFLLGNQSNNIMTNFDDYYKGRSNYSGNNYYYDGGQDFQDYYESNEETFGDKISNFGRTVKGGLLFVGGKIKDTAVGGYSFVKNKIDDIRK